MSERSFSHLYSYSDFSSESIQDHRFVDRDSLSHATDMSRELYDSFSKPNLFLSQKVKEVIQENGSITQWSRKIEATLLAKILPEFRQRFPTHQLRVARLKQIWEKVSYHYKDVGEDALYNNGKLSVESMIRTHLKHLTSPTAFSPYLLARQIADKLSECIATIEGRCLKLKSFTKMIWAVQRHLLKDLSSISAKIPYEEHDATDKFIVKLLLEITSRGENLTFDLLKEEIIKNLQLYERTKSLSQQGKLFSTISMVFAKKLYHTSHFSCYFLSQEREHLEKFIRFQLELSRNNSTLMKDEHRIELIQRILALYSLAQELPKDLNEAMVRKYIRDMRNTEEKDLVSLHKTDQMFFIFFNAEMHIMSENKHFNDLVKLENLLVKSYCIAAQLPVVTFKQMDQFELLIWKIAEEEDFLLDQVDPQIFSIIEKELGNVLIDNPLQSLRMVVSTTVQFFKKVHTIDLHSQATKEKIEMWVVQNDMLIRWVHFNDRTPLLLLLKNLWKRGRLDESSVNHKEFIERAFSHSLKRYSLLRFFSQPLLCRLWILYKYLWYAIFTDGSQATYERFLLWHYIYLKCCYPNYSEDKVDELLCNLSNQLVPLVPFKKMGKI